MQAPHRTVRGSTFIRLLARLADVDAPPSSQSLPDRLSQWLGWTHALALSMALDGKPTSIASDVPIFRSAEENECARVRASLAEAIAGEREWAHSRQRGTGPVPVEAAGANTAVGYARHHSAMQRAIQAATGSLRGRLRDMLAQKSERMARLAEVDAVMELVLSPREQTLLAAVPALLGTRFERLRQAAQADAGVSDDGPAAAPGAWLDVFRKDMQSVLLAELDVRFQPVEGLLAALRASQQGSHGQKSS